MAHYRHFFIEGSVAKLRPASMAVAIMFGLSFACMLTLLVAPVLFAIFYGIREPAPAVKKRR